MPVRYKVPMSGMGGRARPKEGNIAEPEWTVLSQYPRTFHLDLIQTLHVVWPFVLPYNTNYRKSGCISATHAVGTGHMRCAYGMLEGASPPGLPGH